MRIVSLNLNGVRAAGRKGFYDWMKRQRADVFCLQETKAWLEQLEDDPLYFPRNWHARFRDATRKKGYSGVALYSRREPDEVLDTLGMPEFDAEGRYLEYRFGNLSVVSLYVPSGSSGEERLQAKYRFMDAFLPMLQDWMNSGRDYVICGDWNIAHREIDLKNWKSNQKNSGFLPEEREWLSRVFDEVGWVDSYRVLHPETTGESYTWWSNRGRAWDNNVGWRLDYQIVTPGLRDRIEAASVYKRKRFSDHAPLTVDYHEPA